MANRMKAVQVREYGGPDRLEVVDLPTPKVGPREVLVRMKAAGVNPVDWKLREGYIKEWAPLPWVPGGAGVVEEAGGGSARRRTSYVPLYVTSNAASTEVTAPQTRTAPIMDSKINDGPRGQKVSQKQG